MAHGQHRSQDQPYQPYMIPGAVPPPQERRRPKVGSWGGNHHLLFRVVVFTFAAQLPLGFIGAAAGWPPIIFWAVGGIFCAWIILATGALGYSAYRLYQWVRSL